MANLASESKYEDIKRREQEERELFFKVFSYETDRGFAITAVVYLDNALEKLIRAAYIQDPKVKSLFGNNQILQTFYNKISIAYFSGLISKPVYHDLLLVGEIRSRFAHGITANLRLSDESISKKINSFQELPDTHHQYPERFQFSLIVSHLGALLRAYRDVLLKVTESPLLGKRFADLIQNVDDSLRRYILTPDEIEEFMKKTVVKQEDSK